ncbi:MAG: hypothetical protein PHO89_03990 [Methylacidiphilaceae bacterium]|nr:hypothetical protein [Candidatus Methylacidiphilaceae bacterium]
MDDDTTLINTLLRPAHSWDVDDAIRGVASDDFQRAPKLWHVLPDLRKYIKEARTLVLFGKTVHSLFPDDFRPTLESAVCAGDTFSVYLLARERESRWHTLEEAASMAGYSGGSSDPHRALGQALATRAVWRWLCDQVRTMTASPPKSGVS